MDPEVAAIVERRMSRGIGLIAVLAAGGGLVAAVLLSELATPPPPVGEVAGVTFAPPSSSAVVQPSPTPTLSPTPTPTPVPLAAHTGRLSGTWLITQDFGTDARLEGMYPRELLLNIKPRCDEGACSVTASLVDPRSEKTLSTTGVKFAQGYRFSIAAENADMCRGEDSRTVAGAATRTTSYEVEALARPGTADALLAITGDVRFEPNTRGRSVGCRATAYPFEAGTEILTKATRATVPDRLTPIPDAALVPLPDFTVKLKGVRMVYYPVKGTSASQLAADWAEQSSKKKYCGQIDYAWHTGNRQTTSCLKLRWEATTTERTNRATGSCVVVGVDIKPRFTMPIARLTGPEIVPRGLVTWWKATQVYVRDHEAGHLKIDRAWFKKLRGRLDGVACSKVDGIYRKWSKQLEAAQERYDKREYGRTEWPAYPADAP